MIFFLCSTLAILFGVTKDVVYRLFWRTALKHYDIGNRYCSLRLSTWVHFKIGQAEYLLVYPTLQYQNCNAFRVPKLWTKPGLTDDEMNNEFKIMKEEEDPFFTNLCSYIDDPKGQGRTPIGSRTLQFWKHFIFRNNISIHLLEHL